MSDKGWYYDQIDGSTYVCDLTTNKRSMVCNFTFGITHEDIDGYLISGKTQDKREFDVDVSRSQFNDNARLRAAIGAAAGARGIIYPGMQKHLSRIALSMGQAPYEKKKKSWQRTSNIKHYDTKPKVNIWSGSGRLIHMMYNGYYLFESRKRWEWAYAVKLNQKDVSESKWPIDLWKKTAEKYSRVEKVDIRTAKTMHANQYLVELYPSFDIGIKCYGLSKLAKSKLESRQNPGEYTVDYYSNKYNYRDPCHGDKVEIEVFFEDVPSKVIAYFDSVNDGWYLPGKGWTYGDGNYKLIKTLDWHDWVFVPDIWLPENKNKPTKTERTMIRFFEKDGTTAVQTDAKDEREFLDDISLLLIEMMDDKEKKPQVKENLRPILSQIFDICCAYNNYKNNVAKKTLYTAGQLVAIEPFAEVEHEKPGKLVTSNGKN